MQTYILTVDLILLHNSRCTSLLTIVIFPRLFSHYSPTPIIFFILSILRAPIIVSTYTVNHSCVACLYGLASNSSLDTVSEAAQTRAGTWEQLRPRLAPGSVDHAEEVEEDCVDLKEAEEQGKEVARVHRWKIDAPWDAC